MSRKIVANSQTASQRCPIRPWHWA